MTCHDENPSAQHSAKLRILNDKLRREMPHGRVLITRTVGQLSSPDLHRLITLVREFDEFSQDNDPWGEHDFGKVSLDRARYFWKIDAYDLEMNYGSPDPSDDAVTKRVITIISEFEL